VRPGAPGRGAGASRAIALVFVVCLRIAGLFNMGNPDHLID
jgi:hypothetical protein